MTGIKINTDNDSNLYKGFTVTDRGITYKIRKVDNKNHWVYGDKTFEDVTIGFNMSKRTFEAFITAVANSSEEINTG
jgi:hypothetical protein